MIKDYMLEEYISSLSMLQQKQFYKNCFDIVIDPSYNYNNNKKTYEVGNKYLNNMYLNYYSYKYFLEYATPEEKIKYQTNPILAEKLQISKEYFNLETEQEQLEYIYNYCEKVNWSQKKLIPLSMTVNTSSMIIRKKGIKYAIEYLKMSEEEIAENINLAIKENRKQNYINSKYNKLFRELYYVKDYNQVIDILRNEKIKVSHMLSRVENYVKLYKDDLDNNKTEQEIINDLIEKIEYYSKNKKEAYMEKRRIKRHQEILEKENELLTLANPTITKLINYILSNQGTSSLENIEKNFCISEKIKEQDLKDYKKVLEKHNQKLYIEYFYIAKSASNLREKQILITAIKLIDILVKEIIVENSIVTKFKINSIDYYSQFDIPLTELYEKIDKLNLKLDTRNIKLIKYFTYPYSSKRFHILKDSDIYAILNETTEKRCQKDENGVPITGTGTMLTREEKIQILKYLKENNIPEINRNIYKDACEKYLDGELFKLLPKTKKLTKI